MQSFVSDPIEDFDENVFKENFLNNWIVNHKHSYQFNLLQMLQFDFNN